MKKILIKITRFVLRPVFLFAYKKYLPNFHTDFHGKRVHMISELPGGEDSWRGIRRRNAKLGNTHPWNRYFNKQLSIKPKTLADIEAFLRECRYLSDQKSRGKRDYWEPPDVFEKRKKGDCEDHAIWAWRQLHDLGYRTRFVLGKYSRWHAWVHIFVNGRVYMLEATQKHKWFPNTKSYDAYWSVEMIGRKKFAFFKHQIQKEAFNTTANQCD